MEKMKNSIDLPVFERLLKTIARALIVERHTYFKDFDKEQRYFRLHIDLHDSENEVEDYFMVDPDLRIQLEVENKAVIEQIYIISMDNRDAPLHNFEIHAYRFSNAEVKIEEYCIQKDVPDFIEKITLEMKAAIKEVAANRLIVAEEGRSILEPCHEYYIFRHVNDDIMSSEVLGGFISMRYENKDLYYETRGQIRIYREVFNENYLKL
ncbi:hypothetical protein IRB23SM22_07110 [Alkalibacterium sp. s-m-22]